MFLIILTLTNNERNLNLNFSYNVAPIIIILSEHLQPTFRINYS